MKYHKHTTWFLFITVFRYSQTCLKQAAKENIKKVQVGNDQEKARSEKKIPTPKTEAGKTQTNNKVLIP